MWKTNWRTESPSNAPSCSGRVTTITTMPTDEEFLKRVLEVVKDGKEIKPDYKLWWAIIIAIASGIGSYAVMGERVSRLQRDLDVERIERTRADEESARSRDANRARIEAVDRTTDKAIDTLMRVIPEMQTQLKDLWYKSKALELRDSGK